MAILLNQLIDTIQYTKIQILAGEDRLSQGVKWVHVIETLEAADFVDDGELVICTGVGLSHDTVFFQMIQVLIEKGAVGFIVNVGPFIKEVPSEIIDYCKEKQFPLFTLPWRVHLAEIMQLFCMSITRSEQDDIELAAAIKNALYFPMQENLYLPKLIEKGLKLEGSYQIGVLAAICDISKLSKRIEKYLSERSDGSVFYFTLENQIVFLFSGEMSAGLRKFNSDLLSRLSDGKGEEGQNAYYFGVGKSVDSLTDLHISYQSADKIISLQKKELLTIKQIYASDLGLYSILTSVSDKSVLQEYYQSLLAPLLAYDRSTKNTLSEVLYYYLSHNGSVQDTAAHFYVHRNTINYKLNKAAELLHIDLSDWNHRYELMLAFQCLFLTENFTDWKE